MMPKNISTTYAKEVWDVREQRFITYQAINKTYQNITLLCGAGIYDGRNPKEMYSGRDVSTGRA